MEPAVQSVSISVALGYVKDAAVTCLNWILDKPVLVTVFAGGTLATLAFKFIRKAKRAAR